MAVGSRSEVLTLLGMGGTVSAQDLGLVDLLVARAERRLCRLLGWDGILQADYDEYYPDRGLQWPQDLLIDQYEVVNQRVMPVEYEWLDKRYLPLRNVPVRSITNIYENSAAWNTYPPDFSAPYLLTAGAEYQPDERYAGFSRTGLVIRRFGIWCSVDRAIRVQYSAGFTEQELATQYTEFKEAINIAAVAWFTGWKNTRPNPITGAGGGAVTSESLSGWSQSYAASVAEATAPLCRSLPPTAVQQVEQWMNIGAFVA